MEYGSDWGPFESITENWIDYMIRKAWELYFLNNLDTMSNKAVAWELNFLKVEIDPLDTELTRRIKLRLLSSKYKSKGLAKLYLDIAEKIVGVRGEIISGITKGSWIWNESIWPYPPPNNDDKHLFFVWQTVGAGQFDVLFNVKTTDESKLNLIVSLIRQKSFKPAFYRFLLIDDAGNILRRI